MLNNNTTTVLDAVFDLERDARKAADHYAFRVGYLEAQLKYAISSGEAKGIKITNLEAYVKWANELIAQSLKDANRLAPR